MPIENEQEYKYINNNYKITHLVNIPQPFNYIFETFFICDVIY